MEKEKEDKIITKLVNGIKSIVVILVFMFLIAFVILSFGVALGFLDSTKPDEYKSDDDLMREWFEKVEEMNKNERKI